jgi:hypothetical protein
MFEMAWTWLWARERGDRYADEAREAMSLGGVKGASSIPGSIFTGNHGTILWSLEIYVILSTDIRRSREIWC